MVNALYPKEDLRLPKYLMVLEATGIGSLIVVASLVYFFPRFFAFMQDPKAFFYLLIIMLVVHLFFFSLELILKRQGFFTFTRYGWIIFFAAMVYISGGLESPIIFVLLIPLLVSTVDLNKNDTKAVGFIIIGYLTLLFLITIPGKTVEIIGYNLFTIFIFSIISYYAYLLVREALQEKSEKRKAREEVEEMVKLDRVKSDFITVASHRLRTPLSGILWALTEMKSEEAEFLPKSKYREIGEGAVTAVNQAIGIVNELIKSVEIDDHNYKLLRQPADIAVLIMDVIRSLDHLAKKNNVKINVNPGSSPSIQVDIKLLLLALENIIDNAIRYNPNGEVNISWCEEGRLLLIYVKDTGVGITEEDAPYIFERFYRGKNALTIEPNASGVGLYTAKKIIELHGGSLSLISKPKDLGTKIEITLPK